MYIVCSVERGGVKVKGVVVGVGVIIRDEGCEVGVVVYVEYAYGVVERMWENVVLACVSNGVMAYRVVIADDRCEVCRVLCDNGVLRVEGGKDCFLKCLDAVRFWVCTPSALIKMSLDDEGTLVVCGLLVAWQVVD